MAVKLLGTMPDQDLARRIGRSFAAVRVRRYQLGLPNQNPLWKSWTEKDMALLGKFTDQEVSTRTGHSVGSVKYKRLQLGILGCKSKPCP